MRALAQTVIAAALASAFVADNTGAGSVSELRVCADPNNMPFSNARHQGFENEIVALLAEELDARLSYIWWPQRRGYVRNTLDAGRCDLVAGVASGMEMLLPTRPYYRSSYVFVTRADGPEVGSLDDPILHRAKIGVQLVGEDGSSPPPGHALSRRGIINNVRGYMVYGDYQAEAPGASIIDAVADKEIDIGIVWGPLAGYFAKHADPPLRVTLVRPEIDGPRLPMVFDISMGVRSDNKVLRETVDAALMRLQPKIDAILAGYGVPLLNVRLAPDHETERTVPPKG
jgi:mxaJ protein